MLTLSTLMILWIMPIIGFGTLFEKLIEPRISAEEKLFRLMRPLLGMGFLSLTVNIINFFSAITAWIALFFLVTGWILFIKEYLHSPWINWQTLITSLLWLSIIAWAGALAPLDYFDTGLYGLQSVRWLQENPIPLGLANLHGRYGFNSAWFSLASLLQLPFDNKPPVVANEILIFFVGVAIAQGFYGLLQKKWDTHHLFLSLMGLPLLTPVLGTFSTTPLVTDLPIFWITIGEAYILLIAMERTCKLEPLLWMSLMLGIFAITIKLSAITLMLTSAAVLWMYRDEIRAQRAWFQKSFLKILGAGLVLGLPWLLRNYLLSGCWAYPISISCYPQTTWSVPQEQVKLISDMVRAWARVQSFDYSGVLSNWNWLDEWLYVHLHVTEVVFLLIALAFSLGLLILTWAINKEKSIHPAWLPLTPFVLGIFFWFFTAPAMRFGSGNFWAVTILSLVISLSPILGMENKRNILIRFSISCLIIGIALIATFRIFSNCIAEAGTYQANWIAPIGRPPTEIIPYTTHSQQIIYTPLPGQFTCWDSSLLCTPQPNPKLNFIRTHTGRYVIFYTSK